MSEDYKATVYLPQTNFPMKAGLATKELELLDRWEDLDVYRLHRKNAKGLDKFILHDGPPYANGHLHIGHALNKILKDVITRSQQMLGKDANYVPGWDCHGLPIEWKIEEQYRKNGEDKDKVPIAEFRRECREFAEHWIEIQKQEFKRLGIIGDWENPYTTMSYAAEAQIVSELWKFLLDGSLYRGAKPVLWSVVEKTALAEAEVEYLNHTSNTIYARFGVRNTSASQVAVGASIIIWTTTPWTIPGNRGIAYSNENSYVRLVVKGIEETSKAVLGEQIVVAEPLVEQTCKDCAIIEYDIISTFLGEELMGTICDHPLFKKGYDFPVPLLSGNFVDMDTGTGFVHIAPGHGYDDWELGVANDLPIPETVMGDGIFSEQVPLFAGHHVFKVDPIVIGELLSAGNLLASGKIEHSYPHSWRSKAPLIFRNTPQWFISMNTNNLREKALVAIERTKFFPNSGKNRLAGMIEARPDWCVSRQRAWGVPICVFVNKETGEVLRDVEVLERIIVGIEKHGADIWFTEEPGYFLGPSYDAKKFEQVKDILDVWFDSGSTHSFVLENRDDLIWPASLYLEGTDQHRGWFHSSLLEACGTRGQAPYEAVLTHGFVMAEDGQKMSKSLGNITAPQEVVEQNGADILRLWVVGSDYSEDLRIGKDILKHHTDIYRRLRNTLRYLLGNLDGYSNNERLSFDLMPELELWVFHRLSQLDKLVRDACNKFEFHHLFNELHNFCANDLSAFYFDIRKDSLYCDRADSNNRKAARTVLDEIFRCLTVWLAPFICFTAEEAWLSRYPGEKESVHLQLFPEIDAGWESDSLEVKWNNIRDLRRVVTGAVEIERAAKRIGSSLEAHPMVYSTEKHFQNIDQIDWAEIFITSEATLIFTPPPDNAFTLDGIEGVGVVIEEPKGEKCIRCYKITPEVGTNINHIKVCNRCADAADHFTKDK